MARLVTVAYPATTLPETFLRLLGIPTVDLIPAEEAVATCRPIHGSNSYVVETIFVP